MMGRLSSGGCLVTRRLLVSKEYHEACLSTREAVFVTWLPAGNRISMKLNLPPVQPGSTQGEHCPVRDVLDCIGDRWSLLTLLALQGGTLRFTELKRSIGDISQRMLAQTLRALEKDGYLQRKVYPCVPPKVEYRLTDLGRSLLLKLEPLVSWAEANHERVRRARKAYVRPTANPAR